MEHLRGFAPELICDLSMIFYYLVDRKGRSSIVFESFPAEPSGPSSKWALFKHVLGSWVYGPIVALARSAQGLWQLDETFIQAQVVADGVFPALKMKKLKPDENLKESSLVQIFI